MKQTRRNVLKSAGAVAAPAATGGLNTGFAKAKHKDKPARGIAHGLTLLTIRSGGAYRLGVKTERGILDVQAAAKVLHMHAPATMDDLLQNEDGPSLNALVDAALKSSAVKVALVKEDGVGYGPVVTRPEKIVCVGLNYRKHAQETGAPIPKQPVLFSKFNTTLNHHNGTVKLPVEAAAKFDYEVELVIVMGREAKNVTEADALSYVAGYCTGNDFTARDLQYETGGQWLVGKTPDQFAPLGPYMVTADQANGDNLKLDCPVNRETRHSSNPTHTLLNSPHI